MKRTLIASILGIAACAATSAFGQGSVWFSSYISSGSIVTVGYAGGSLSPGHAAGELVPTGFTAQLYYGLGSGVSFGSMTLLSTGPVGSQSQGIITDGVVTVPNYVSGAITFGLTVTGPGGYSTASPVVWTEPSIAALPSPANFWTYSLLTAGLPAGPGGAYIAVQAVPEPGTMTMIGLGAAALLALRRRQ
jgi:hypothetical protein